MLPMGLVISLRSGEREKPFGQLNDMPPSRYSALAALVICQERVADITPMLPE